MFYLQSVTENSKTLASSFISIDYLHKGNNRLIIIIV